MGRDEAVHWGLAQMTRCCKLRKGGGEKASEVEQRRKRRSDGRFMVNVMTSFFLSSTPTLGEYGGGGLTSSIPLPEEQVAVEE